MCYDYRVMYYDYKTSYQLCFCISLTVFFLLFNVLLYCMFQITVYLGKRDFVDHLDHVDPVGELTPHLEFQQT